MAVVKKTNDKNAGEDVGKEDPYSLLIGIYTASAAIEIPMKVVQRTKSRAIMESHRIHLHCSWVYI